jgi:hypothetical protein
VIGLRVQKLRLPPCENPRRDHKLLREEAPAASSKASLLSAEQCRNRSQPARGASAKVHDGKSMAPKAGVNRQGEQLRGHLWTSNFCQPPGEACRRSASIRRPVTTRKCAMERSKENHQVITIRSRARTHAHRHTCLLMSRGDAASSKS